MSRAMPAGLAAAARPFMPPPKGGIIDTTKSLAREVARYAHQRQLRVPRPDRHANAGDAPGKAAGSLHQGHPVPPFCQARQEIADATPVFRQLTQTDYVTGQILSISGGLDIFAGD